MRIAVVGSGISGLGAASALAAHHEVTLFEQGRHLGGHANTVDIEIEGKAIAVDTGFIVYNEHNYPLLTRMFAAKDVPTEPSDMSFAVSIANGRREYCGSLLGLAAQPANLLEPSYLRMIRDILRFSREAPSLLDELAHADLTLGDYLRRGRYADSFLSDHLLPMAAAIWSSSPNRVVEMPAAMFVRFFHNHGLLRIKDRPQWRTVAGGSREYVRRLMQEFAGQIRLETRVTEIRREETAVTLVGVDQAVGTFDHVVLATHGDQALALLAEDASDGERQILSAFEYQENHAVLHIDEALMPQRRRVWSSWNYLASNHTDTERKAAISYWMNRLQPLPTETNIFVTVNPWQRPADECIYGEFVYAHPQFDNRTLCAQREVKRIQGQRRTWFCGSYCGYGFHEDGLRSGLAVAAALGARPDWASDVAPAGTARTEESWQSPAVAAE